MKHAKSAVRALVAGGLMMGAASAAHAETFKWAFPGRPANP